jgi:hypothetical protein
MDSAAKQARSPHIVSALLSLFPSERFEGFAALTMEKVVFVGYENLVRNSQETYFFSATELSLLMIYII